MNQFDLECIFVACYLPAKNPIIFGSSVLVLLEIIPFLCFLVLLYSSSFCERCYIFIFNDLCSDHS